MNINYKKIIVMTLALCLVSIGYIGAVCAADDNSENPAKDLGNKSKDNQTLTQGTNGGLTQQSGNDNTSNPTGTQNTTPTVTPTATQNATPTVTPTATQNATPTVTPTATQNATPTVTPTPKPIKPGITLTISPKKPIIPSNENKVNVTFTYKITGSPTMSILSFGDGDSKLLDTITDGYVTHEYTSPNNYTAKITSNNANGTSEKEITFTISKSKDLKAQFDVSSEKGEAPFTVNLKDSSIGDIKTRTWNFGDGKTENSKTSVSHTYTDPGTYTIKLTVSDGNSSKESTKTITVTEKKKTTATVKPTKTPTPKPTATPTPTPEIDSSNSSFIKDPSLLMPNTIIGEFVGLFKEMGSIIPSSNETVPETNKKDSDKKDTGKK